jgi:uncharacterized protein (PEP-CTERM system associated)
MTRLSRLLMSSAVVSLMAGSEVAHAQMLPLGGSVFDNTSPSPLAPPTQPSTSGASTAVPATSTNPSGTPTLTGFQLNARALASETYITNATGIPGGASQQDYMSTLGLTSDLHDHTARLSLDAMYSGAIDYYDHGTVPTQFVNILQALGDLDVIPQYLDIDMRAFAQPIVTSDLGALSADNRVIPGSYYNSYGYFETPDLKFDLGDFATSKTMPSIGQVFFTRPAGTSPLNTFPGFTAPDNTTLRSVVEEISSGPEFDVLKWKIVGLYNETDSTEFLLTQQSGVANGIYALSHEWSLLATGGYDAISDTIPLKHDVTGPAALGGFGLTLGENFSFKGEAGERYNSFSFDGGLRYDISPTTLLSASAQDYVTTPEGQFLNNLTSLTALPDGTLASANDVLGDNTASSLAPFNVQSLDTPLVGDFVARYRIVSGSFTEKLPRTTVSLSLFGTRMNILTATNLPGPPILETGGVQTMGSYNVTRVLVATLGATYTESTEFSGHASTILGLGQLTYSLSPATNIFLRASYLDRISSSSLVAVSPLAGDITDFQATLGISHAL